MAPGCLGTWMDADGAEIAIGDWIEVWCSWTRQPKFDGRPVQVIEVMGNGTDAVFRLRDPEGDTPSYMPVSARGYRRSTPPPSASMVVPHFSLPDNEVESA